MKQNSQPETPPGVIQKNQLEIREHISREMVRGEKDKIFLFGDNLAERGFGGQAKEIRGEENAIGIPTKKVPSNNPNSFFTDKEFTANIKAIDEAFGKIPPNKTVVIPKAGLGTGLAGLEEKAPKTFAYLSGKLAELGFINPSKELANNLAQKSTDENKVIVQTVNGETPTAKRLLDLNNIQTNSLKILSPTEKEIDALKIDSRQALADYADRLRLDYKSNKDNFRDGLLLLSDSLEKGEQITVTCSSRGSGAMCHADVVKMAIEKVNVHLKNASINKGNRAEQAENLSVVQENFQTKQVIQEQTLNPRTQRAINEILSFSKNDRVLEKIGETDGRNRSEQASYLGQFSQLTRDIFERGANVVDGNLIVPQEKLTDSHPLAITTESFAVSRLGRILRDEERAKELAPLVVECGKKIAGITADGETKLKVFGWMYESLEGKNDFGAREVGEKPKFEETLKKIRGLAEEMHSLEPIDKNEFVPLIEIEHSYSSESFIENKGETLNPAEIYEEAISQAAVEQNQIESFELEQSEKINTEGYERIDLRLDVPRIPEDYTQTEISKLINETLPDIDRQLENGITPREILAPFNAAVRQSAGEDAIKRLESIYQKQQKGRAEKQQISGKPLEINQRLDGQPAKIDVFRQNIIELKSPNEYLSAEKKAINTFYKRQKQEVGNLLTKIDDARLKETAEKIEELALKKELNQVKVAKPNFAFKLENSLEIVVGFPSQESVESRNFIASYINYQLKTPETRLRFENERYRDFAVRLESAATRDEVLKTSSEIRAKNASFGLRWKELKDGEKEKLPRPLTNREMQFLFTEPSPAHYTNEMTAARLSFAHSGASRRAMTESLLKGEIKPSPEAHKLIESLDSRLQRRDIKDSLLATKHFFESVKTPNDALKYKNSFDHREIYQKLPSQEKDFVYTRATQQKENLEYQLSFKKLQLERVEEISLTEQPKTIVSPAERSFHLNSLFHQARILGDRIDSKPLMQNEISDRDVSAIAVLLKNQPVEKLENLAGQFQKSENAEKKKIGEILQTFNRAEISKVENKTIISIKLPENTLVSTETYRELLEKFYPDDMRQNEKYKFEKFGEKDVSRALQKGQDETINNFREEIKGNSYQKDAPENVLETEKTVLEKLDKIAQFQAEARNALRENKSILNKYVARAGSKLQKPQVPSPGDQKEIVSIALGGKASNLVSNKVHDQFLQAAQKEIPISDYQKFKANEKFLGEAKFDIKYEFAEISRDMKSLEEAKLKTEPGRDQTLDQTQDQLHRHEENKVTSTENKPLSQQIYEKELKKAEKGLLAENLSEKHYGKVDEIQNLETLFSSKEREEIRTKAAEIAKEKLEPKELNADHRKVSFEAGKQALTTFKQLERAANVFEFSNDKHKIREAFAKLDIEAAALNKIRQDYGKSEKIALLREGIKADIIDLFSKTSDRKTGNFSELTKEILSKNFHKAGFAGIAGDSERIVKISREIGEKLEAKQLFAGGKGGQILFSNESKETQISGKILEAAAEKLKPKYEQAKDLVVRSR